jgi:DNA-binding MarR family transcriptional regulator
MNSKEEILHILYTAAFILKKNFSHFVSQYNLSEMEAKFIFQIGSKNQYNDNKTCDLIDFFKKHKSTITQKTKSLEEKGFIIIEQGKEDRRERVIHLTKTGMSFYKKLTKIMEDYNNKIFQKFTKQEEEQLRTLLKKLDIKN